MSYNAAVVLAHSYGRRVAWIDANFMSPQAKLRSTETVSFAAMLTDPERADELLTVANPVLVPAGADIATGAQPAGFGQPQGRAGPPA